MTEPTIERLVAMLQDAAAHDGVTLFVGAGISLEPPAQLPGAHAVKTWLLETLTGRKVTSEDALLQSYIGGYALELLIQDLRETCGPGVAHVLNVFRGGHPNLYHRVIARMAKQRLIRRVITTNFDCLLERALADDGVPYHALATEHDFAELLVNPELYPGFHVLKLHGTVAFMDGPLELPGRRAVKAISPLKLEMRRMARAYGEQGRSFLEAGLHRTISAEETLIASLDRLGLYLPEVTAELFTACLRDSTLVVLGWNGFDIDIAPLIGEHARRSIWIVHVPEHDDAADRRASFARNLDEARRGLRARALSELQTEMALLANIEGYEVDVLPTPATERTQLRLRSPENVEFEVYCPALVDRLVTVIGPDPLPTGLGVNPLAEPHKPSLRVRQWPGVKEVDLPLRWGVARFLLGQGEYASTHDHLTAVIDGAAAAGLRDVVAMALLDLGDLNGIYGNRAEAVDAYERAIRAEADRAGLNHEQDEVVDGSLLNEVTKRAYFGIGEVACEFFDFAGAAAAFARMPADKTIVRALVHYCHEEFADASRLLSSQISFRRIGTSRFHHYLLFYLKLLDGRMHLMRRAPEQAERQFHEVLSTSTKLGFPRLQVQALNGLSLVYAMHIAAPDPLRSHTLTRRPDRYADGLKSAKFAAQAITVGNQAQYRYGRAHAGLYFGVAYAEQRMPDVATSAIRHAEGMFARIGHSAGMAFCSQARTMYRLSWESPTIP